MSPAVGEIRSRSLPLTAVLVGASAGLLAWAGGFNPPNAILIGDGALASMMLLVLTAVRFNAGLGRVAGATR